MKKTMIGLVGAILTTGAIAVNAQEGNDGYMDAQMEGAGAIGVKVNGEFIEFHSCGGGEQFTTKPCSQD